ncbi:MAG: sulfatase, partial [Candidatus Omnitrophota bacterium]
MCKFISFVTSKMLSIITYYYERFCNIYILSAGLTVIFILLKPSLLLANPNIIIFYVDDMGWMDWSDGSDFYETPNMRALADQGVKFMQAYSPAANSTPSRACLLTGRTPARLNVTDVVANQTVFTKNYLEQSEITIAEVAKTKGYKTCLIGKWHLGAIATYGPQFQGFDTVIGTCDNGMPGSYFWNYNGQPYFYTGTPGEYLTDRLTSEAEQWIRANKNDPFLLYLSHYGVHVPIQAKQSYIDYFAGKADGLWHNNDTYAAMLKSIDDSLGKIMQLLVEENIVDNTIIIFSSDNGGEQITPNYGRITNNYPLREGKTYPYEGGIRIPLIIKWPGVTSSASIDNTMVGQVDLFPTICEMINADLPQGVALDGVSIAPLLSKSGSINRDALYWHFPHYRINENKNITPYSIIRKGDYKLIKNYEDNSLELYNINSDISESNNIAESEPGIRDSMHQELRDWLDSVGAQLPLPAENMLENADFGNGVANWDKAANVIISPTTAEFHSAPGAALVENRTVYWHHIRQDVTEEVRASGPGWYKLSAWVKRIGS